MKVYLLILFVGFLSFTEGNSWCIECPGKDNLLANVTCDLCENAYYDADMHACVDFMECSIFDLLTPAEVIKYMITSTYDNTITSMSTTTTDLTVIEGVDQMSTVITDFTNALSKDPLFNSFITKDMSNVLVDVDAISEIVRKRFDIVKQKCEVELKQIFNPYIFTNKKFYEKFSKQCNSSKVCVGKELVVKYKDRIANATVVILTHLMEQLVECVKDIGVFADNNCVEKECPLIKYIWVFRLDIQKMLSNLTPYLLNTCKSFIYFLTTFQVELLITKIFNILVSKFASNVKLKDVFATIFKS